MNYRNYVANSLFYASAGKRYTKTLYEIEHPKPVDTRTGEEIAKDVINNIGLKFGGE